MRPLVKFSSFRDSVRRLGARRGPTRRAPVAQRTHLPAARGRRDAGGQRRARRSTCVSHTDTRATRKRTKSALARIEPRGHDTEAGRPCTIATLRGLSGLLSSAPDSSLSAVLSPTHIAGAASRSPAPDAHTKPSSAPLFPLVRPLSHALSSPQHHHRALPLPRSPSSRHAHGSCCVPRTHTPPPRPLLPSHCLSTKPTPS